MNPNASVRPIRAREFAAAVLRAVTWRAVLLTQLLGVVFAVNPWLEGWGQPTQPSLLSTLAQQASAAAFLMLGAFAADEAVRRGWTVSRAFVVAMLCASGATALTQWGVNRWFTFEFPGHRFGGSLNSFLDVGSYWGIVLMVYLNRQSATRLLASVRGGELSRIQAERRLLAADVAAVAAQIDPAEVSRQLARLRDLYAADSPQAESGLEALITSLREKVAQCARVP